VERERERECWSRTSSAPGERKERNKGAAETCACNVIGTDVETRFGLGRKQRKKSPARLDYIIYVNNRCSVVSVAFGPPVTCALYYR